MNLKKLGASLAAILAIGAVIASSASAAVTTTAAEWYTGTPEVTLPVGTDLAINATIGTHPVIGAKFDLHGKIGAKEVTLTATGVTCVGCQITNAAVTGKTAPVAMAKGKIKFTGVTVDLPNTNCKVRNGSSTGALGEIETKPLVVHADWMNGTTAYQQFMPESGEVFATVYLEAGECEAIEGPYNVTGTVFSEAKNATGVQAASQENVFSPAVQTATGGALKLGANAAELTGTGIFSLANGAEFNIH